MSSMQTSSSLASFWRVSGVRRAFWLALTGALLLSLATPMWQLWRSSSAQLEARACLWPATPRAGAPAQVFIVMPVDAAPASLTHSTQEASVVATMPTMVMTPQQAHLSAAPRQLDDSLVLMIPIQIVMAGDWTARVTLQPPGHGSWHGVITFHAQDPGADGWTDPPVSGSAAQTQQLCP